MNQILEALATMHPDFQALRIKMVDGQLRTTDVTNREVLAAFLSVPRELFVAESQRVLAYLDDDIKVAPGRFMMAPSPLAKLLQLALIKSDDKVLIVGSGTGYSAAICAHLSASVIALESDGDLLARGQAVLASLNITNVESLSGELAQGAKSKGPFDVILHEGAVAQVSQNLLGQLVDGGRLVTVEGLGLTGVAKCYIKSENSVSAVRGFNLAVKPLPGFEPPATFVF